MDQVMISLPAWALPRESIAISGIWPNEIKINRIEIRIPNDIEFEGALNVGNSKLENNILVLSNIKFPQQKLNLSNYASIIVSAPMQEVLKRAYSISWRFFNDDKLMFEKICFFRVFRPLVKILNYPESITINDEGLQPDLKFQFQWIGFGDIKFSLKVKYGGKFVSQGISLFEEIIHRIYHIITNNNDSSNENDNFCNSQSSDFEIDPKEVNEIAIQITKVLSGELKTLNTDDEIIQTISTWLREKTLTESLNEFLRSTVESLLIQILLETLDKNPIHGVRMQAPKTEINAKIETPITRFVIQIEYTDNMDNEYQVQEVYIPVTDNRSNECKTKRIKAKIIFGEWKDSSFKNIERIKIDDETN